ncbi:RNA polymerase factor sigma-54 [Dolosicoccus paucivorans]|uniref:RNA polymerase sigma factor 54 core-binding domain-containing protein n=1 Tax=Dolosicoccus paucivorans TaxID=84521 RepID=A0A1G8NZ98_9LACT|nr:hypothetical protein [Dolosicoccus paucivorans]PMB85007.1 hypothetical protein CJ206_00430 [Dolosicoccus paucivorans]PMC57180.1 hypothetical protein CJ205_08095 [Dolosicoccus paucivorans]SDI85547.1 RNA polymerase, sigma 54 subunit, RpoN/SigL [Dolosicoccus paucivorans]
MRNQTLTIQQTTPIQSVTVQHDSLKVQERVTQMLPLTAEQLTLYLETVISPNPFIEMVYPKEVKVAQVDEDHQIVKGQAHQKGLPQSLHLYLSQQIMHQDPSPMREVMLSLIDQLDKRGYITRSYKELAKEMDVHEVLMLDALNYFKRLDPAGIGAKDLREALLTQTLRDDNAPTLARYLLDEHFDKIATVSSKELADSLGVDQEAVEESISYYQTLNPAPASLFHVDHHEHLVTDYSWEALDDSSATLTYHGEFYPTVEFNKAYYEEMASIKDDAELQEFVVEQKEHYDQLNEAFELYQQLMVKVAAKATQQLFNWLMESVEQPLTIDVEKIAHELDIDIQWVQDTLYNKNIQIKEQVYSFNDWLPEVLEDSFNFIPPVAQSIVKDVLQNEPTASIEQIQDRLKEADFYLGDLEVELFVAQLED